MAELRTRYNELLGIPNEIKDPDLYQLLGLSRGGSLDGLDAAYRESMSTLQRIRSPKHKSFIEFLKGELRTAKATLGDPRKRAEYDARLLAERRSRVEIVLDVVLADGFLTPVEEARVVDMAAQSGLLPDEAQLVIEEQLERRGARRVEQRVAHPPPPAGGGAAPARPRGRPPGRAGAAPRARPPRRAAGPPPGAAPRPAARKTLPAAHRPRAASDSEIQAAIARKLGFAPTPPQPSAPAEPEVVAEVAAPPPRLAPSQQAQTATASGWGQAAQHPATRANTSESGSGWGAAAVVKPIGVCGSCLNPVHEHDLAAGAERLSDGRLHCRSCTTQLVSGTLCMRCYQRFTQQELRSGGVATHQSRAYHRACLR